MRQALTAAAAGMALVWTSGAALAGPISPTLQFQAQESWHTSLTTTIKGKTTTTIADNTVSSGIIVDSTHSGRVEFSTAPGHSFGTFSSLSATGLGYPLIGAGPEDEVDLSAQVSTGKVSNVVAGSVVLTLLLTETGLTTNLGILPFDTAIGGTIGKGMVVTYKTYVDPTDQPFGESVLLTNSASLSSSPFAWGDDVDHLLQGLFSLTEVVTISALSSSATAATSFDASLSTTAVPEPGTVMILGLPLTLIGIAVARRKSVTPLQ
jgi:hypothetical protein